MNILAMQQTNTFDNQANSYGSESSRLAAQAAANDLQTFANSLATLHRVAADGQNVNGELVVVLKDATEQFPRQAIAVEGLMQVCGHADEFVRRLDNDNENKIPVAELSDECQQITSDLYQFANMSLESAIAPTSTESKEITLGDDTPSTTTNSSALSWEARYAAMGDASVLATAAAAAISAINVSYASVAAFQKKVAVYNMILDDLNGFMSFLSLLSSLYAEALEKMQTVTNLSSYSQTDWNDTSKDGFQWALSALSPTNEDWTYNIDSTGVLTVYWTADSMPDFMKQYCTTTKDGYYGVNPDVMNTVALQISSEVASVDDTNMAASWTGTDMQTNTQTSAYTSACSDYQTTINSNLSSLVSQIQLLQQGVTNMQSLWSNILSLYQNIISSLTK